MNRRLFSLSGLGAALAALIGRAPTEAATTDRLRLSTFVDRTATGHDCALCPRWVRDEPAPPMPGVIHILGDPGPGVWLCDECAAVLTKSLLYVLPNETLANTARLSAIYPHLPRRAHILVNTPPQRHGRWDLSEYTAFLERSIQHGNSPRP